MREWSAARQHVQSMKATDPRGAERLNKNITAVGLDISGMNISTLYVTSPFVVSYVISRYFITVVR